MRVQGVVRGAGWGPAEGSGWGAGWGPAEGSGWGGDLSVWGVEVVT